MMKNVNSRIRAGLLASLVLLFVAGCSTQPVQEVEIDEPTFAADRVLMDDVSYAGDVYDPWSGLNRRIYVFNANFDRYVFLPVVAGYQFVMPDFAEQGVSNFFSNLSEIRNVINSLLQLKIESALIGTWRFMINTSMGVAGLFDPATSMGAPQKIEDFGQTLGHWGVPGGPFIVLPLLGPSNLRDTTGLVADSLMFNEVEFLGLNENSHEQWLYYALKAIDARSQTAFRYYQMGSPMEYEMVRMLYSTKREMDIEK